MEPSASKNDTLTWDDIYQHGLWWLRAGHNVYRFGLEVVFKNWLTSLLLAALCSGLLLAWLFQKSQQYEMKTTFVYSELHPKIFGDMGVKINSLIASKQVDQVASLLALNEAQAEKVKKISITDVRGKSLVKNYTFRKEPITISVLLSEPINADSLHDGVTYYLNSNPFTGGRLDLKTKLMREELHFIEEKLETIDTAIVNLMDNTDNKIPVLNTLEIEGKEGKQMYELLSFSREMVLRRSEIQSKLANPENVVAIDNFIILPKALINFGSILKHLLVGIILGLILSAMVVLWRQYLYPLVK